jgi:hypothetical protein
VVEKKIDLNYNEQKQARETFSLKRSLGVLFNQFACAGIIQNERLYVKLNGMPSIIYLQNVNKLARSGRSWVCVTKGYRNGI